jgi:RNA-directed DNA polymerase
MKRENNIYQTVCSIQNLIEADKRARKNKKKQPGVIKHDQRRGCNTLLLHNMLVEKTYRTSPYSHFTRNDPKPRQISALPYWPDRVAQHAAMIPTERIFNANFTADTYSCIKGKGVGAADRKLVKMLKDVRGTEFCLKIDVTKFYPSIDHDILKKQLHRKFKDNDLLDFYEEIIDSAPGVPIGNYISQYFANFNLSPLDHWLKEKLRIKYYVRYADDMIFFSHSKDLLHQLRVAIQKYLAINLNLTIKSNYQVQRTDEGVDVLGLVYFHTHKLLRKRNKQKLARAIKKGKSRECIAGHLSLAKHCNSKHLLKKLKPNGNTGIKKF